METSLHPQIQQNKSMNKITKYSDSKWQQASEACSIDLLQALSSSGCMRPHFRTLERKLNTLSCQVEVWIKIFTKKKEKKKSNLFTIFLQGQHRLRKSKVTLSSVSVNVTSKRIGTRNLDYCHFVVSCHVYLLHWMLETSRVEVKQPSISVAAPWIIVLLRYLSYDNCLKVPMCTLLKRSFTVLSGSVESGQSKWPFWSRDFNS